MALNVLKGTDIPSTTVISDSDSLWINSGTDTKQIALDDFKTSAHIKPGGNVTYKNVSFTSGDLVSDTISHDGYISYYEMTVTGLGTDAILDAEFKIGNDIYEDAYALESLSNKFRIWFKNTFTGTMTGIVYITIPNTTVNDDMVLDAYVKKIDNTATNTAYDNTDSGLTATNTQDAIDEVKGYADRAGVSSFNTRQGAVVPVSGDYTAAQITRGSSNVDTDLSAVEAKILKYLDCTVDNPVADSTYDGYSFSQTFTWTGITTVDNLDAILMSGTYEHNYAVDTGTNQIKIYLDAEPDNTLVFRVYASQPDMGTLSNDPAVQLQSEIDELNINLIPLKEMTGVGHNAIYRGKALGSAVTAAQWAAIGAGTFDDLWIGDYWTIGGVNYQIAAFDYWLHCGDNECRTHHVVLVPDKNMYSGQMNTSDVTTGGYPGSAMRTNNLAIAKTMIKSAFGAAHILTHREYMENAVTNGKPAGGDWFDSDIDLMNERMVYGGPVFTVANNGSTIPVIHTTSKSQLALFRLDPSMITDRADWWLRDPVSATNFACVDVNGLAIHYGASDSVGIRPAFGIRA